MTFLRSPVFTIVIPAIGITLLSIAALNAAAEMEAPPPLSLKVYHADRGSFNVNAVLVSGKEDAILLDTGFTRADALRITAMVLDSHKNLKTIYISQSDPDYYFGTSILKQYFPDAKLVATQATVDRMKETIPTKLKVWASRMGDNAPDRVPLPEVLEGNTLMLEEQVLEIRGLEDTLPHRSYVWIPSIKTIAGGVNVVSGLHVWTADTQTAEERAAWIKKLHNMAALNPEHVIPGHSKSATDSAPSSITWTQDYLTRFEQERARVKESSALIKVMKTAYPDADADMSLEIGTKVNTGEMKW